MAANTGKPTRVVCVRLPVEQAKAAQAVARKRGVSLSDLLRPWVQRALKSETRKAG